MVSGEGEASGKGDLQRGGIRGSDLRARREGVGIVNDKYYGVMPPYQDPSQSE